jgi:excisionase family DNA binding protein
LLNYIREERMNPSEIMTIEECAKYLKTSLSTLYKLAQVGKIPAFKLSGQCITKFYLSP